MLGTELRGFLCKIFSSEFKKYRSVAEASLLEDVVEALLNIFSAQEFFLRETSWGKRTFASSRVLGKELKKYMIFGYF